MFDHRCSVDALHESSDFFCHAVVVEVSVFFAVYADDVDFNLVGSREEFYCFAELDILFLVRLDSDVECFCYDVVAFNFIACFERSDFVAADVTCDEADFDIACLYCVVDFYA